ncbi:hypothetical protein ACINK0_16500 [Deinococcus sp. VB343]|uniref:Uncharacterized protein n=1 Tax=Deinococcus sp. VB142 TaxID=3112952 RepID=A0AAU6Q5S9_9DEIO
MAAWPGFDIVYRDADGSVTPGPATYTIPVQAPQTADLTVAKSNTWTSTSTQVIVSPDASSDIVAAGTYSRYDICVTDHVPDWTTVVANAYDSGSSTGLGIKLTRGGKTILLSSAADSDAGSLSSTGGTSGQGTLSADIGTLNAGETGSLCFQVRIR